MPVQIEQIAIMNSYIFIYSYYSRFETERWDSPIEGFAFRVWEWNPKEVNDTFTRGVTNTPETTTTTPPTITSSPSTSSSGEEEEEDEYSLENLFKHNNDYDREDEDDQWSRQQQKQQQRYPTDIVTNLLPFGRRLFSLNEDTEVRYLTVRERVFYVTLNHTRPHVREIHAGSLLQRCWSKGKEEGFVCTPRVDASENSSKLLKSMEEFLTRLT